MAARQISDGVVTASCGFAFAVRMLPDRGEIEADRGEMEECRSHGPGAGGRRMGWRSRVAHGLCVCADV